jgi:hypothetical protein
MSSTCFEPKGLIFRKAAVHTVMVWYYVLICIGINTLVDRLCGLVVRVSGYRYRGLGFDPGATTFSE